MSDQAPDRLPDQPEQVFTWQAPPIKFGPGAVGEVGYELRRLGVRTALLVTDPGVAATGLPDEVAAAARAAGVEVEIYAESSVEPTDVSIQAAVEAAGQRDWDGFLAVGGGSSIDTAKAINLYTSHPAALLDYVNKPIGGGVRAPGPLKPLIAVPTTAGTGSECTSVCVLDLLDLKVKSGISDERLRPALAIIDPLLTVTMPAQVTAASGMDILGHAIESYTARSYDAFAAKRPEERVAYCGANPISDVWAERAISLVGRAFRTAVAHGDDVEARTQMMMAAMFAGMGFGNAGVQIPHACAYPIAGNVRDYVPEGYVGQEPLVPHGQAVAVTTPATFRLTYPTGPARHEAVAAWLDPDLAPTVDDPRERLPQVLSTLMRDIGIPNGISALGYGPDDVPTLVAGAAQQHRLLATAPLEVGVDELTTVLSGSLTNW